MPPVRVTLLIFLLVFFSSCSHLSRARHAKALLKEAAELMKQDSDITKQWTDEFLTAFTAKNRAEFPANRDFLRTHAAQIIKLVDESSRLNNHMALKYEEAATLSDYDQRHKGMISFAAAVRKTVEMNELVKSQMQMVSDESVADAETLNEEFSHSWELIQQKKSQRAHDLAEGKRLLGL